MANLLGILNLAQGGLSAASTGISVAGENITGANVAGYSRRRALLENRPNGGPAAGGVHVAGVQRAYSVFAERALLTEEGHHGAADARTTALSRIEGLLQPGDGIGLDDRFASFFAAFDDLAQKPDDLAIRRNLVLEGQGLALTFNRMAGDLDALRADLLGDAQEVAAEVNERLAKIAVLDAKVASVPANTSGRAELQDERDRLVREVAERIAVQVIPDDDGSIALLSSGVALYDGGIVRALSVTTQAYDPANPADPRTALLIEATLPGGSPRDITANVTGGRLGGLREARDQDAIELGERLDELAFDFAAAANATHAAGLDLDGNAPPDLFVGSGGGAVPAPPGSALALTFNPAIDADLRKLAAGSAASPPPGGNATALALSALQQASIAGAGTPAERVGRLAALTGNKIVAAEGELRLRENTRSHAEQLRDETSGVSLDEEMIELTKFQRAFQASVRVLQTAEQMLQEIVERL